MKHATLLSFVAGILGLACGCATTVPARVHDHPDAFLDQGRVQFESHGLRGLIRVESLDMQRMNGRLLKLIATLRNKTDENLWVECRTTFLDKDKHVLDQTNWEPILLDARTVTEYACTSLSNRAEDYQVIIRRPAKTSLKRP